MNNNSIHYHSLRNGYLERIFIRDVQGYEAIKLR